MRRDAGEPQALAGAYVMDALDAKDRACFERHLARCEACAREVSELRETTARLAAASAVPPPPGMKERLLFAAARTSQHAQAAPRAARLGSRHSGRLAATAAAAALVVLAVALGLAASGSGQRLSQMDPRSAAIAAVLTARDATMMTAGVSGGGIATIVMSHRERALVFTAADLPVLPASRGYELWLAGPGGQRPAGILPAGSHGMTGPVVATGLRTGDHLMLAVEPAAGALHLATPAILDIPL